MTAVILVSSVIVLILCLTSGTSCHRMEAAYENMLDVGPMERPGYFEQAYNGRDRGYGTVGHPYHRSLPVPKLVIKRTYRKKAVPEDTMPEYRALFDFNPGNLPLNFIPNIAELTNRMQGGFGQNMGVGGGLQFTRGGQPTYGVNYGFNRNYGQNYAGAGSIKGEIDNSGVTMSPNRANGW